MKRVTITGANGFIGSHLVSKLIDENYEISILCRKNSNLESLKYLIDKISVYRCDDNIDKIINSFKEFKPEYLIHLAAFFSSDHKKEDINNFINSNIKYPSIILEAMNECGIKNFINTGTAWQNYNNEDYNPVCLYAATKEAFEKILEYYSRALSFKSITLKLFDSYGDNDNRGKLISVLQKCAENNIELDMTEGNSKMDLTYIDDITNAFFKALQYMDNLKSGEFKKYAICTGRVLTLREIVKIFEDQIGYKLKINWGIREYRNREVMEPWNNYELLPNWKSEISFEEGIERLYK